MGLATAMYELNHKEDNLMVGSVLSPFRRRGLFAFDDGRIQGICDRNMKKLRKDYKQSGNKMCPALMPGGSSAAEC